MRLFIQAMETNLTMEELRKSLPPETLKKLEGKTITPYVIGEEGESHPRVIGEGHKTVIWPRAVIRTLAEKAKSGIKLFVGHNEDSSHNNRRDVGEVVASFTRVVSGKLQALALTVVNSIDKALDVCSIEADVDFSSPNVAGDVNKITGIALGSSKTDSPAFPGAVRMAQLQCFGAEEEPEKKDKTLEGDKKVPTFDEIKKAVQDMKIYPHQLFSEDEMKGDRFVAKLVEKNESLTKEVESSNTKLKDLDEAGKENERKASLSDAKERFAKIVPEGATDKQKAFYEKNFKPDALEDLTDEGLKKTFEKFQEDFSGYAKMFGNEEKNEPSGGQSGGESEKGNDNPIDSAVLALMEED